MAESLRIPREYNGPLESGNGGYCAGVLAGLVDGPAEVSLRRPVPLETPLDVDRADDGSVRALDGEAVVAIARPGAELDVDVPAPVSLEEAHAAKTRYRGLPDGLFSRCFVCGRARDDGLAVFAGAVEGRRIVASPWTPAPWTADDAGRVRPEFVWAALDCPTYFATYVDQELAMAFLAGFAVRVDGDVVAGEEHVVVAWPIEVDRRKRYAGAALLSGDGTVLASARALVVEPRAA